MNVQHQDAEGLNRYMESISRIPMLTSEQEYELARRWRDAGDREAAQRLVNSNLRFVVKVAQEYSGYRLRLADMVQEGNVGLVRAVERYDPDRGVKLISYAVWWIRAEIQSFILRAWSMVKFGTTKAQRRLFFGLHKTRRELRRLGIEDTDREVGLLAEQLGTTRRKVYGALRRMEARDVSLDQTVHEEGQPLLATLPDAAPTAEALVDRLRVRREVAQRLRRLIPNLSERERFILEHRFLADEPLFLKDVAAHYGVSGERIRQIESRLKRKLRACFADLDAADADEQGSGDARDAKAAPTPAARGAATPHASERSRSVAG